jgi:hypothetical protein
LNKLSIAEGFISFLFINGLSDDVANNSPYIAWNGRVADERRIGK